VTLSLPGRMSASGVMGNGPCNSEIPCSVDQLQSEAIAWRASLGERTEVILEIFTILTHQPKHLSGKR